MMLTPKVNFAVLGAAIIALSLIAFSSPAPAQEKDTSLEAQLRRALVKVHITRQSWDLYSPWKKNNPGNTLQRGVMVRPGQILTLAGGLTDAVMIEVSVANSARRYPASLAHMDYAAGLALVKIDDDGLRQTMEPLPIGDPITIDDTFDIWQLGSSDLVEKFTGHVQKVAPSSSQLRLTVKTNLSDPGDGQVVMKDGKMVGLVIQTRASRQEGLILAQETIQHYLTDYDSGEYRGFGTGPFWYLQLLRDDFRDYYEVPEDVHGIAISRVIPGRTGHGVLEAGDVIAEMGGHSLDDEGMYKDPRHGRLHFHYLLYGATHPGDEVSAKIYRTGKAMDVKIPIRGWPIGENRVPFALRNVRHPYMVVGGMVILELTRQHRGSFTISDYQERSQWDPPSDRKRIVFLSRVLADKSNKGLDDLGGDAIATVNGKKITGIADVDEALKSPVGGFHVFEFEGINRNFVIKAADLAGIDERIAKTYRIAEMKYLGGEDGGSGDGGEEDSE